MYWLSYGGGVNSTALAVLLCEDKLPQYDPFRIIFADTLTERPETYRFIEQHFIPYLRQYGKELEIVRPKEGVLERWERLKVTGSRRFRTCTRDAKIIPIKKYIEDNGGGEQLIGIDAGEAHRMPDKIRPLVELDIDREQCEKIIRDAGLPSPGKSGCWCCPFARVGEIIALAKTDPCRFERIAALERAATETHGAPDGCEMRTHWHDKPVAYWRERAAQGDLIYDGGRIEPLPPCGCYDG
jgi:hypothetical protein